MSNSSEAKGKNEDDAAAAATIGVWDCGSPLYDSYELVSLSHVIERHLMKLPSLSGSMRLMTTRFPHQPDHATTIVNSSSGSSNAMARQSSPSAMASLGGFLGSKLWKRRRFGDRRDKPKRMRTVLLCFGHPNSGGFAKKVDIQQEYCKHD